MNLERTLIYHFFLWKSAIFHPIKLSFDVEAAERILKVIYCLPLLLFSLLISWSSGPILDKRYCLCHTAYLGNAMMSDLQNAWVASSSTSPMQSVPPKHTNWHNRLLKITHVQMYTSTPELSPVHCKFFPYKKQGESLCPTGYPVICI